MEIKTTEATLKTFSVTIKGILVNDKQMTLAVFRQIPPFNALLENNMLNPTLRFWGIVRYSIKDEGHLWAVADKDEMLVRCKVYDTLSLEELKERETKGRDELKKIADCNSIYKDHRHCYAKHETETWKIERHKKYVMEIPAFINEVESMKQLKTLPQLFIAV